MLNKSSIATNALWHTLAQLLSKGVRFLTIPIIVRLLEPEQLGDVAITMAITLFVATVFGNGGTIDTMVYFCKRTQHVFKTLFWFTVVVSGCLSSIVFGLSAHIVGWFGIPSALIYIQVMSLFLPVVMLQSVFLAKLIEQQSFAYIAKCQALVSTVATLIAIALAFSGFGAWSLISQHVFTACALSMMLYRKIKVSHDEHFTRSTLTQILPYYYKSTLYNTVLWLGSQSPLFIVSKSIGSAGAGIYSAMGRAACIPMEVIGRAFQLSFFSELSTATAEKEQKYRLQQQFFWSIKFRFLVLTTLYTLGALLAEPVTHIVLGAQYALHSDVFFWLCLGFATIASTGELTGFLQGTGRINIVTILSFIRCSLVIGMCYLMWCVNGTLESIAQGFALANVLLMLTYLCTLFGTLKFSFKDYLALCIPLYAVLFTAIGAALVTTKLIAAKLPPDWNPLYEVMGLSIAFVCGFIVASLLFLPLESRAFKHIVKTKFIPLFRKHTFREQG